MNHALWSKTTEKLDISTGPLAHPFARLLALLTHSLALHCSLCSRATLYSFVCLPAHSLTPELVGKWMIQCFIMPWICLTVQRAKSKWMGKWAGKWANKLVNEQRSGQMSKRANEWANEQTSRQMSERASGQMSKGADKWANKRANEPTSGQMSLQAGRWANGRANEPTSRLMSQRAGNWANKQENEQTSRQMSSLNSLKVLLKRWSSFQWKGGRGGWRSSILMYQMTRNFCDSVFMIIEQWTKRLWL